MQHKRCIMMQQMTNANLILEMTHEFCLSEKVDVLIHKKIKKINQWHDNP
jgi:hypothetical protein